MKNFKELITWQKGIELVKQVYQLNRQLPNDEKFGLIAQLSRAAVSIPANIAEGSSRHSAKDYGRFLQISLGSAFEVQTYFVIIKEMKWVTPDKIAAAELLTEEEIKMIHSFIKKLKMDGE
jgi:four helix bundle protein